MTGPGEGAPRTKPSVLRPQARTDRRSQVQHDHHGTGAAVAGKLVKAMANALQDLERKPSIGSPALGRLIGIDGIATWRPQGFPLTLCDPGRADHIEVIRLLGQRQDQRDVES